MPFSLRQQQLFVDELAVFDLAEKYGTPCYIYSATTLRENYFAFEKAFPAKVKHLVCFAVKANPNLSILRLLASLGAGFDIVSQGELERVLQAGAEGEKIVFSGVGKTVSAIERALDVGIRCFNVESESELLRIAKIAQAKGKVAPISLRINPDINAQTHPYISTGLKENKFGIPMQNALEIYLKAKECPSLKLVGIDCHIGSQLTDLAPFKMAAEKLLTLIQQLHTQGIQLQHVDLGGGLGVAYNAENPPSIQDYVENFLAVFQAYPLEIIIEPGRAICADAGILVTQIEYLKQNSDKHFAIVNTGMQHLLRPALYQAQMPILEIRPRAEILPKHYDVVGPICESADCLGKNRLLRIQEGDYLAILKAGAYGISMASNYNSQPLPISLLVEKQEVKLIQRAQTWQDLWALEDL